jgi:hypothetical protein
MMNTSRQTAENKNLITGLYDRLSVDDALDGTSNSIINQQNMLEDYAAKHGFSNVRHFTDDGYSGSRWDRPGWKALVEEIEAGNVGVLLCKDMTRIGRDYLQVGFYTEVMFRKHGVRFIAVCNNIDSNNQESAEFAPFLNLMSEWYVLYYKGYLKYTPTIRRAIALFVVLSADCIAESSTPRKDTPITILHDEVVNPTTSFSF